jgi:transposase InsO family protein
VRWPTDATVCGLLQALCVDTPPPLVLKVDNGAAFVSQALQAWARAAGTVLLYSPLRCPRYNGTIEASIASITTRAHHAAVAAGHPTSWTCADVEAARQSANAIVRPSDHRTAAARWQAATPITDAERRRFAAAHHAAERRKMGVPIRVHQRMAVVEALQQLGYVSITRRADLVHQLKSRKRQELRA